MTPTNEAPVDVRLPSMDHVLRVMAASAKHSTNNGNDHAALEMSRSADAVAALIAERDALKRMWAQAEQDIAEQGRRIAELEAERDALREDACRLIDAARAEARDG